MRTRPTNPIALAALIMFFLVCGPSAEGDDWPQLQHDAAHTGYTADQPQPPFRLLWHRDLKEPMATANQVIVAEAKVFATTGYGNLYALDRGTGDTVWVYKTLCPILGSATYAAGRVYVNSMDHHCHAVEAENGQGLWKFATGEGLWAAPVVAEGKVFIGGRDGFVYALDAEKGTQLWRSPVGGLVMCTPAYAGGTLYVAAGDMHVYAFDAKDGRQIWKSPQIPGAAIREYWLVAAHGTVVLTSQLAYACHPTQQMIQRAIMAPYNEAHKDDPVLRDHETFGPLQEWLTSHPDHKTLLLLDAVTGREKYVAPIITVNGGSCIGPMPAVTPDGWAYTVYGNIQLTASGWAFFGRYNLKTGVMEPLIADRYAPKLQNPSQWHWQPKAGTTFGRTSTWDGGFSVIDQSWGVSIGGDMAFPVRDPGWPGNPPFHNYFQISTRTDSYLLAGWNSQERILSDLNLGTVGGGAMHNTCSPAAISGNCLFHKTSRSVIFAFAGASPDKSAVTVQTRERARRRTDEAQPGTGEAGPRAEIPRKPGKDNANVLDGLSWIVDLNEGWPILSRLHGHLPLDAYRRIRDNILTVSLGLDRASRPQINRRAGGGIEGVYSLGSDQATVTVNRLSPAVLFETPSSAVGFGGGAVPKYLAFVSGGELHIHSVAQGGDILGKGLDLDEPWVLLWYGDRAPAWSHVLPHDVESERGVTKGPSGYDRSPDSVDLPILIRLEHQVRSIREDTEKGLVFEFGAPAGKVAVMPLAGGRLFLPEETQRWVQGLPEEIVAQCRQWSSRLACFPLTVHESSSADPSAGIVTVRQRFEWTQFQDAWGTKVIKAAPVPPMLASAVGSGLPIQFTADGRTVQPMDYGLMDTAGLAMGIEGVDEYEYTVGGLKDLVAVPSAAPVSQDAGAKVLQAKLEEHVRQMVEAGHLAPLLYIYGGIGGTWFSHCYWGTSTELARAVAAADPHLSESLQAKTLDYLRSEWKANPPFQLDQRRYFTGRSRTSYELPWRDMDRHANYAVSREAEYRASDHLFSLYGVDAYLRLTGEQPDADLRPKVSAAVEQMLRDSDWAILGPAPMRDIRDRHAVFYYNLQGAATYNRWLAGAIGAARLTGKYGWTQEQDRAWSLLAKLAVARVAQARYVAQMHRHGLVRGEPGRDNRTLLHIDTGCAVVGRGPMEVGVHQNQEAPPFNDLVAEVGRLLGRYARAECRTYLEHLDHSLPFWYISEAPKQQATEHRTSPLQYYSGNVLAQYWILDKHRDEFARYLDTTRFTGDLYYLQNLAACLDSYDKKQ